MTIPFENTNKQWRHGFQVVRSAFCPSTVCWHLQIKGAFSCAAPLIPPAPHSPQKNDPNKNANVSCCQQNENNLSGGVLWAARIDPSRLPNSAFPPKSEPRRSPICGAQNSTRLTRHASQKKTAPEPESILVGDKNGLPKPNVKADMHTNHGAGFATQHNETPLRTNHITSPPKKSEPPPPPALQQPGFLSLHFWTNRKRLSRVNADPFFVQGRQNIYSQKPSSKNCKQTTKLVLYKTHIPSTKTQTETIVFGGVPGGGGNHSSTAAKKAIAFRPAPPCPATPARRAPAPPLSTQRAHARERPGGRSPAPRFSC